MRETIRKAIIARLIAAWDAGIMTLAFANQKREKTDATTYARASLLFGKEDNAALGGAMTRVPGALILQVFVPHESGTAKVNAIADLLRGAFGNRVESIDNVHIRYALVDGPKFVGSDENGERYNVSVDWTADRTGA